jgi:tRNA (mo5U34)-methyltransferase
MKFYQQDYLNSFSDAIDVDLIKQVRQKETRVPWEEKEKKFLTALEQAPDISTNAFSFGSDVIKIGSKEEITSTDLEKLEKSLRTFLPWKKGPFEIFGTAIDAEWRSDFKWARLEPFIEDLTDKKVADIGCSNGYYMFRMMAQNPRLIVGFEPYLKYMYTFLFLQKFAQIPNVHLEPFGVEHIGLYPNFFDVIFCLGILYHHTDPVGILRKLFPVRSFDAVICRRG